MDRPIPADGPQVAKGLPVALSYLEQRLDLLRRTQNSDGGWGYFPGRTSWLEPTAYAVMALHGEPAADRAWQLLSSWQTADGGWRPSAAAHEPGWGTSICLTIALGRAASQPKSAPDQVQVQKSVSWLVSSAGAESNWILITMQLFKGGRNFRLHGWPWKPGDASWVEPTSHALVALKQAFSSINKTSLRKTLIDRVKDGEAQLLDVRSRDGGWNYGNADVLGVDLPSYPETTAIALVGLQEHHDLTRAFEITDQLLTHTPSPLARAWLAIARQLHGLPPLDMSGAVSNDLMLTALEALAAPEGNHWFLKTNLAV